MGLFGFVKKAIGKVAKVGLGSLTGGVSNQVFDFIDARKRQQHLKPIANELFDIKPTVKGGGRVKLSAARDLDFAGTQDAYGVTPGELAELKRRKRLANLAKAREARRKKLLG